MSLKRSRTLHRSVLATVCVSTVLITTACSTDGDNSESGAAAGSSATNGDVASDLRAASGDLSAHGGARRYEGDQSALIQEMAERSDAKNVILLIGDGMGDSEITVARNYAEGASGAFSGIDALPMTGQYTHYSLDKDGNPDYVTDSAASGTAWASGTKSYNGAIGVDINGDPQETLLQKAKAAGKGTGNVSTAELQDATPAVQAAHISQRKCYGPEETSEKCSDEALENGGLGSISEQILDTRADITLGGGAESFGQTAKAGDWADKTLLEQAKERGYQIPTNLEELEAVSVADQDSPVLGLFSDGNMPVRWKGETATKGGYLEEAQQCEENEERTDDIPTLATMTTKAIDLLEADNEDGFFLQVEGASIDKEDHAANPCGQIGETVDLDEAVQEALAFAEEDGDTLVIVTADHAHTSQIVSPVSDEDIKEIAEEKGISEEEVRDTIYPGLSSKLRTDEGQEMVVAYATSDNVDTQAQGHTGAQLRIAAYGPGSANVVGLTDQTDLHFTVLDALNINDN